MRTLWIFIVLLFSLRGSHSAETRRPEDFVEQMRKELRPKLPELIKKLESPNPNERNGAALSLGLLGPEAKAAVPGLLKTLKDSSGNVAWQSAGALGAIDPGNKEVVAALLDSAKEGNRGAAIELGRIKPVVKEAVPLLLKLLESADNDHYATALGSIGTDAVPSLLEALKSPNKNLKRGALIALEGVRPPASEAVPALLILANDKDFWPSAVSALGVAGCDSEEASKFLLAMLKGNDAFKKLRAAEAIGNLHVGVAEAIPLLIEMLKSDNQDWTIKASYSLGHFGDPAIEELIQLSSNADARTRANAIYALGAAFKHIPKVIPPIVAALADKDAAVRRMAARAFYFSPSPIPEAIVPLSKLLNEDDEDTRLQAVEALERVAPGKTAIQMFFLSLDDKSLKVRASAVHALNRLGADAVPDLVKLLKDSNPGRRIAALEALQSSDGRAALPEILGAINDLDAKVRLQAVYVLISFKDENGVADAVERATHDADPNVSEAAKEMLKLIHTTPQRREK